MRLLFQTPIRPRHTARFPTRRRRLSTGISNISTRRWWIHEVSDITFEYLNDIIRMFIFLNNNRSIGDNTGIQLPLANYVQGENGATSTGEDDGYSQAESSIKNGQVVASAQGTKNGGTAQTQVQGTYSGTGSFSASAQTDDKERSAQAQVSRKLVFRLLFLRYFQYI